VFFRKIGADTPLFSQWFGLGFALFCDRKALFRGVLNMIFAHKKGPLSG